MRMLVRAFPVIAGLTIPALSISQPSLPPVELTIDPGAIPRPLLQNVVVTGGAESLGGRGESWLNPTFTPVEPGESLVIAAVRARWEFVAGPR